MCRNQVYIVLFEVLAAVSLVAAMWSLEELLQIQQFVVCKKVSSVGLVTYLRENVMFTDFGANTDLNGIVISETSLKRNLKRAKEPNFVASEYTYLASRVLPEIIQTQQVKRTGLEIPINEKYVAVLFLTWKEDNKTTQEFTSLQFAKTARDMVPIPVYTGRLASFEPDNEAPFVVVKVADLEEAGIVYTNETVIRSSDSITRFYIISDLVKNDPAGRTKVPKKYLIHSPVS